jgi:DNA-binding NarL/FixJ family response regulator
VDQAKHDILVADNHPLCRAGLATMLTCDLGVTGLSEAGNFSETLTMLAHGSGIGLVTVNLGLPGMGRAQGLRQLRTEFPSVRVVVVTETRDRDSILEALDAGVHGYIPKGLSAQEMVAAFRSVIAGQIYVPALISDVSVKPTPPRTSHDPMQDACLTDRQFEVLGLLAAGHSNKEIARALRIAEGTVKVHITAAFRMLGVHNRVSAAAAIHGRGPNGFAHDATIPGLFGDDRRNGSRDAGFYGLTPVLPSG